MDNCVSVLYVNDIYEGIMCTDSVPSSFVLYRREYEDEVVGSVD